MLNLDTIYILYIVIIVYGIVAAIARHSSDTNKAITLVAIISLIGFMIRNYQLHQYPLYLLSALVLFFVIAMATNFLLFK